MRERRKEPREGSEIDPETACIQTVGAPAPWAFGFFGGAARERRESKEFKDEIDPGHRVYELGCCGITGF